MSWFEQAKKAPSLQPAADSVPRPGAAPRLAGRSWTEALMKIEGRPRGEPGRPDRGQAIEALRLGSNEPRADGWTQQRFLLNDRARRARRRSARRTDGALWPGPGCRRDQARVLEYGSVRASAARNRGQFEVVPGSAWAPGADRVRRAVSAFLRRVYGWMFVGLAVTAVVAIGVAGSPTIVNTLVANRLLFFGPDRRELGLVFYLSARVARWRRRPPPASSSCTRPSTA